MKFTNTCFDCEARKWVILTPGIIQYSRYKKQTSQLKDPSSKYHPSHPKCSYKKSSSKESSNSSNSIIVNHGRPNTHSASPIHNLWCGFKYLRTNSCPSYCSPRCHDVEKSESKPLWLGKWLVGGTSWRFKCSKSSTSRVSSIQYDYINIYLEPKWPGCFEWSERAFFWRLQTTPK